MSSAAEEPKSKSPAKRAGKVKKEGGRQSAKAKHESASEAEEPSPAPAPSAAGAAAAASAPADESAGLKKAKPGKGKGKPKTKLGSVGSRPLFARSILFFLRENAIFESSEPVDLAMEDIRDATRLDDVFTIPMKHRVLNLDGCLRFALFLQVLSAEPPEGEAPFTGGAKFSASAAFKAIDDMFDEGVHDLVWNIVSDATEPESGDEDD